MELSVIVLSATLNLHQRIQGSHGVDRSHGTRNVANQHGSYLIYTAAQEIT